MRLVSAVMPTRGREILARQAVDCFLRQTYRNRELVILDDADAPSFPGGISGPGIKYHVTDKRMNTGEKRNAVNALATGEIICHWDDDDWSAPERIDDQVRRLAGLPFTGYSSCLWFCEKTGTAWQYRGWQTPNYYALGTSFCYLRAWWKTHLFPAKPIGSDNDVVRKARGSMLCVDAGKLMVARNHAGSSNKRVFVEDEFWRPVALNVLPAGFLKLIEVAA